MSIDFSSDHTMFSLSIIAAVAIVAFFILGKLLKWFLKLVIIMLLVVVGIAFCAKRGYLSKTDVDRINAAANRKVSDSVGAAGKWVGDKAKSAAKKVIREAVEEGLDADY